MPITPAPIPTQYYAPLTKQGSYDADLMNQQNAFQAAQDILLASSVNSALGFAAFNAAVAITLLPSTTPAGLYSASIYAVVTTTFVTNTTWNFTLGFTDDAQAQTPLIVTSATLTAGTAVSNDYIFRSNGTAAITIKPGVTGSAATAGVAAYSITIQRLL